MTSMFRISTSPATGRGRSRSRSARLVAALFVLGAVGCSTTASPELKPTRAEVTVTGSTSVPLRLIVSTDFSETYDPVDEVREQIFHSADTIFVSELPYRDTVLLTDVASIVVDLSNPSDVAATARLQVALDGGQPGYDREALMSEGGALRYVFNWLAPSLQ